MSVIKKMLQLTAVLATLLPAVTGWAQEADGAVRRPARIGCQPPLFTKEALRYELEGTTVLQYDVDDSGRASSVRVTRSSGWKVLDQMAVKAVGTCRFEQTADPQVVRTGLTMPFNWTLGTQGQQPVPAALVAGSCQASPQFSAFEPFRGAVVARPGGVLVRFLVDDGGKTFGLKLEDADPALVTEATAFIASCRFAPATHEGRPVHGNLTGWLVRK